MTTHTTSAAIVTALLLGTVLSGCGRTPQPEPVRPPPPAPANTDTAPAAPVNPEMPPPDAAPGAPAQPAPNAPPPQESSPVPTPTSNEPALDAMKSARANASAKMSIAAELRYQIDAAAPGGPMTLHLAAVPQVEGSNLEVSVKAEDGIELSAGALTLQKSGSSTVYRRQYAVKRSAAAPVALHVLVTMDMPAGSGFGYFTVPLDGGTSAQNRQDSVKQR